MIYAPSEPCPFAQIKIDVSAHAKIFTAQKPLGNEALMMLQWVLMLQALACDIIPQTPSVYTYYYYIIRFKMGPFRNIYIYVASFVCHVWSWCLVFQGRLVYEVVGRLQAPYFFGLDNSTARISVIRDLLNTDIDTRYEVSSTYLLMSACIFLRVSFPPPPPWYNCCGWIGIKNQLSAIIFLRNVLTQSIYLNSYSVVNHLSVCFFVCVLTKCILSRCNNDRLFITIVLAFTVFWQNVFCPDIIMIDYL